jgi:hypothetical protein
MKSWSPHAKKEKCTYDFGGRARREDIIRKI